MNEFLAALEATQLALYLKGSTWAYPLVNAGHLFGIALLIGVVVPMDMAALGWLKRADEGLSRTLVPFALVGFSIAVACGALLFITSATDYAGNSFFLAKVTLITLAGLNALAFHRMTIWRKPAAVISLAAWMGAFVLGRLTGYFIG